MQIKDSVALVTGANRGIGRAFVEALLERGAHRGGQDSVGEGGRSAGADLWGSMSDRACTYLSRCA